MKCMAPTVKFLLSFFFLQIFTMEEGILSFFYKSLPWRKVSFLFFLQIFTKEEGILSFFFLQIFTMEEGILSFFLQIFTMEEGIISFFLQIFTMEEGIISFFLQIFTMEEGILSFFFTNLYHGGSMGASWLGLFCLQGEAQNLALPAKTRSEGK